MRKTLSIMAGLAAASLMITACSADLDNNVDNSNTEETNDDLFADDGCTQITVATSSEKINLMDDLSDAFKESPEMAGLDKCVTVRPINVPSGTATEILVNNSDWGVDEAYTPTLWSPASSIWVERVSAAGKTAMVTDYESFTKTPVVFAMPESMANALNYPAEDLSITDLEELIANPDGWGSVGKPLWGSFKIAKTNPNTSTTGLNTILMQTYEAVEKQEGLTTDDVTAASDFSEAFELGAIHYGNTTGKVLTNLYNEGLEGNDGSSYVSAIAVEETSLINYNLGNPDSHTVQPGETLTPPREKLVAIYPSNGSLWSDNPIVTLKAPWVDTEKQAAGDAFIEFLATTPAQAILPNYGFRPLDDTVDMGELFTSAYGVDPAKPVTTLEQPSADVVSVAIDQWEDIRKPSAVLELLDISGSMDDAIEGSYTKLDGAIESVQTTLGHFRSTDNVGLWAFTTDITSDLGDNVAPIREFSELGSGLETMMDSVEDVRYASHNGTPLYDATLTAYDYMTEIAEPGRINAIVILSDGVDTDSSTSLSSLLVHINSEDSETSTDAPVRIFTIAYGEGADKDALTAIAEATGGQMFDASDPSRIDVVFASVINNF